MTMTVDDYIDGLPEERRIAIRAVREAINSKLPPGYEEGIVYDMISWFVPWTRLPETYNNQPLCVASLGAQKGHMAVYLMSVYGDAKLRGWFEKAYKASGKKLDMGKSCVRFKKLDDLALDVIGGAIAKVPVDTYVAQYEAVHGKAKGNAKPKTTAQKAPAKKAPAKNAAAKKPAAKLAAKKPAAKKPAAKKPAAKKPAAKKRGK